jgi:prepilin-type N-terminal cleavage/methylation domain-containing protein
MIKLNKLKKKKGFTLVELLVVVAILAKQVLSVALLPLGAVSWWWVTRIIY